MGVKILVIVDKVLPVHYGIKISKLKIVNNNHSKIKHQQQQVHPKIRIKRRAVERRNRWLTSWRMMRSPRLSKKKNKNRIITKHIQF